MSFSNRLKAFATVGADGTALLTIPPQSAALRSPVGSTLQRVVASVPLPSIPGVLSDAFSRVVAAGWGIPDVGPVWSVLTGSGFSVGIDAGGASVGIVTPPNVHSVVISAVGISDVDLYSTINLLAGGLAVTTLTGPRLVFRVKDANNYYFLGVAMNAGGTVTSIAIGIRLAGVETILATSGVLALAANSAIGAFANIRATITGGTITAKAWAQGTVEPSAVNVTATDLSVTGQGNIGAGIGIGGQAANPFGFDNMIGTALSAQAPIWDAYLGPVLAQNLVDSSIVAATRWVPTLATGQGMYRGEALNVVARAAPIGQAVELQATLVTE